MDERLRRSRRSGTQGRSGRGHQIWQASQGREDPRPASLAGEAERFWPKVEQHAGCTEWTGAKRGGYGRFRVHRNGRWTHMQAHRWAWEERNGPIPPGLYPDHTCHNADLSCPPGPECPHRACVDTDHMELVTDDENRRRARERNAARKETT